MDGHCFSCLTYPCVLERNNNCAFGSGPLNNEICMSFWCYFQDFKGNSPCMGPPVSAPGLPRAGSLASWSFQSADSDLTCPHISLVSHLQRIPDLSDRPLKLNMHQTELSILCLTLLFLSLTVSVPENDAPIIHPLSKLRTSIGLANNIFGHHVYHSVCWRYAL